MTAFSIALLAIALAAVLARDRITGWLAAGGAAEGQRELAGGTAGENARVERPVRVVVLDGLSRADASRLPALERLCARGAELVVDVGFPTKSLPVQRVLWSGLTTQQQGDRADNRSRPPPASSIALAVPSIAVAESHAQIARDAGFERVEPPPEADPMAWREGGFVAAAAAAVADPAPLVLVHVLAIDTAAHAHGRSGRVYDAALASSDAALAAVVAAAPDAQWLVLSDHGHVPDGGHGDAEDDVRRVRACLAPSPPDVTPGAAIHLVDLARWIADAVGAPRDPRAVGRALPVAAVHPDPDATLPRPGVVRAILAALLALAGLAAGIAFARPRWAVAWPLVTAVAIAALHGLPTLSHRASPVLLLLAAFVPAALATYLQRGRALSETCGLIAPAGGYLAAIVVLARVPSVTPWWTGLLGAVALCAAGGIAGIGLVSAILARSRE